ncbi:unnamed protein product [Notodromas monacha]|uniref:RIIa domain-containing protein n=1 Tax=Notodromas monacha TaxID=399045 RepID=A0A7R9BW66_9CRUS|nr:unnamed protein product [Notodromas monacha]CAG0922934.1 unnamed protein product [Notodromas monacha]
MEAMDNEISAAEAKTVEASSTSTFLSKFSSLPASISSRMSVFADAVVSSTTSPFSKHHQHDSKPTLAEVTKKSFDFNDMLVHIPLDPNEPVRTYAEIDKMEAQEKSEAKKSTGFQHVMRNAFKTLRISKKTSLEQIASNPNGRIAEEDRNSFGEGSDILENFGQTELILKEDDVQTPLIPDVFPVGIPAPGMGNIPSSLEPTDEDSQSLTTDEITLSKLSKDPCVSVDCLTGSQCHVDMMECRPTQPGGLLITSTGGKDVQYVCRVHPQAPFSFLVQEIRTREGFSSVAQKIDSSAGDNVNTGLEDCLEDFTLEVLRKKPVNLRIFAQQHFERKVRENGEGIKARPEIMLIPMMMA